VGRHRGGQRRTRLDRTPQPLTGWDCARFGGIAFGGGGTARLSSPQTVAVVLALADTRSGWRHGHRLCKQLDLKAGTVYPILVRLRERGQVETTWKADPPAGQPTRHLYRLSGAGAELAEELRTVATAEAHAAGKDPSPRPALGDALG
jgi:PadR family transcriptional regulator, regulatory protein PadR